MISWLWLLKHSLRQYKAFPAAKSEKVVVSRLLGQSVGKGIFTGALRGVDKILSHGQVGAAGVNMLFLAAFTNLLGKPFRNKTLLFFFAVAWNF